MTSPLFLFFLLVGTSVLGRVDQQKFQKASRACDAYQDDVKRYNFCLFKKMGYLDETGEFQAGSLRESLEGVLSEGKIGEVLTKCTVKKQTPEDSALNALTCIENINRSQQV